MFITRLAIRRPTLAFVFVITMLLGGFAAMRQLVVQAQPNAALPTIDVRLEYSGSPPSFIKDHIVAPLEDQIAGSPGLAHMNSTVELGAADILVQFQLGTSVDSDLAYIEQSLQAAQSQLPPDLIPPVTRVVNPAQGTVATIAVHSKKMPVSQLAAFANVQIMPNIEQLAGISDAHVVNLPQSSFEVTVDPTTLASSNLTLTDLISTISQNNVRAPGGLIYGKYETQIDVRGDLPDAAAIEKLPIKLTPPAFAQSGTQGVPASSGVAFSSSGGAGAPMGGSTASGGAGATGAAAPAGGAGASMSSAATGGTGGASSAGSAATSAASSAAAIGMGSSGGVNALVTTNGPGAVGLPGVGKMPAPVPTIGSAPAFGASQFGSTTLGGPTASPVTPPPSLPSPGLPSSSSAAAGSASGSSAGGSMAGSSAAGAVAPAQSSGALGATTAGGGAPGAPPGSPNTSAIAPALSPNGLGAASTTSLTPVVVTSPAAQVPATLPMPQTGAMNATVPAAPMPQIPDIAGAAPGLALQPNVGVLSPFSIGSPNRKIGDYAHVTLASKPVRTYEVLDGQPGVEMQILKFASASEITVANEIEAKLPDIRKQFPQEQLRIDHVQATYSEAQVDGVIRTVLEAIALVAIVMLFFLKSWRNAVVVIVAIPTSLAVTLLAMRILGLTLDVVSLLAMSLVIGTLVDDSTVVLENIERHHGMGEEPPDAALRGRSEIGTAAIVITLVDVVVFLPIAFLNGVVGKQLSEFGIVVSVATLTSLFVSFVVTPAMAGRWSLYSQWKAWALIERFDRAFERLRSWYADRVLTNAMRRPWPWIVVTALLVVGALALLPLGVIGREYIPAGDRPDVYVQITYPSGTSLDRTRQLTQPLDTALNKLDEAESVETTYGSFDTPENITAEEGSAAQLHVYLKPNAKTASVIDHIRRIARDQNHDHAQVVVFPADSQTGSPSRSIEEIVSHNDQTDPSQDAGKVERALRATPGTIDVTNTSKNLAPEVQVEFDRDMARTLDVPIGSASTAIRAAFGGATASQITTADQGLVQIDVIYPRDRQLSLDEIGRVPIRTNDGRIVHVEDVAHLKYEAQPAILTREDRADVVRVSASLAPGYELSNVLSDFRRRLAGEHLGDNVAVADSASSNAQLMNEALAALGTSLIGSFVLVYLLMVALYNSFRSPLIVLFAIPPATIGAMFALAITHSTLNLYSLIGTILLVGLVTKNSILLVDYANTLRRERDMNRTDAIVESAKTRFRPIMMTTIAMIVGLLPVALGLDPGAASRRALGIVVIGGLSSSLVLTLVLVPLFYRWIAPKERERRLVFADERHDGVATNGRPPAPAAPAAAPAQ